MKRITSILLLALLAALPVFAQTNTGLQRFSNTSIINNGNVCWEATPGGGADVCIVRTAAGVLAVTLGDALTAGSVAMAPIGLTEAAAPSNVAGTDTIYADSSAHRVKGKNNGGGATTYALFTDKLNVFAATSSAELAGVISDETGSGLLAFATSPTLTTPIIGAATATSVTSAAANAATAGVLALANGDVVNWKNQANAANIGFAQTGAAAATNGNIADVVKYGSSSTGGIQAQAFVDFSALPANSGVNRYGNNVLGPSWRNAANGADVGLTVNASNFLLYGGSAPTDGSYFVGPENCSMALTTGTFAANPANSGGQSAPAMVRAASGNTVLQLTTTAAANTTDVVCDFSPPTRLTSGKGVTITAIQVLYGYQTTALTSIGTLVPNKITYPASAGAAAATVAAIGGALTVTAGTSHGTPGAITTAGQCYSENISFGTPYAHVTDLVRLNWQNTFVQSAAAATVMQICGTIVYYSNINSL